MGAVLPQQVCLCFSCCGQPSEISSLYMLGVVDSLRMTKGVSSLSLSAPLFFRSFVCATQPVVQVLDNDGQPMAGQYVTATVGLMLAWFEAQDFFKLGRP